MKFKKETILVRSGLNNDEQYGCVVPPMTLSTIYSFLDYDVPRAYDYSRRNNPIRDLVQESLSELEGGVGGILTNSGMSAIFLLCIAILKPNDLLIAPHDCYGGSYRLLDSLDKKGMCKVRFVNQGDENELLEALFDNPRLVFIETPSNPLLRVVDIKKICNSVRNSRILYAVDNTFMSPILQQPFKFGADFVIHSCTKYLNGHSDVVSGVIITKDLEFFKELSWWANVIGVTASAFDCYQLLRGLRTLYVRVDKQQSNAKEIVAFLDNNIHVKKLYYPGLSSNVGHDIACNQQTGFGAIVSFELNGDLNALRTFLRSLSLFTLAESFGGIESLISHPATMSHASMPEEVRARAGISNMLLRISVGLEDTKDLIKDLDIAFKRLGG